MFWDESSGEFSISLAYALFGGSLVNLKNPIIVNSISGDSSGKRIFLGDVGYSFENVCQHVACGKYNYSCITHTQNECCEVIVNRSDLLWF